MTTKHQKEITKIISQAHEQQHKKLNEDLGFSELLFKQQEFNLKLNQEEKDFLIGLLENTQEGLDIADNMEFGCLITDLLNDLKDEEKGICWYCGIELIRDENFFHNDFYFCSDKCINNYNKAEQRRGKI